MRWWISYDPLLFLYLIQLWVLGGGLSFLFLVSIYSTAVSGLSSDPSFLRSWKVDWPPLGFFIMNPCRFVAACTNPSLLHSSAWSWATFLIPLPLLFSVFPSYAKKFSLPTDCFPCTSSPSAEVWGFGVVCINLADVMFGGALCFPFRPWLIMPGVPPLGRGFSSWIYYFYFEDIYGLKW